VSGGPVLSQRPVTPIQQPMQARARSTQPAPQAAPMSEAVLGERMNANTVTVISGTPGGTYFRMASDMAFVLDDGDNLRILPILGKGAGQNAYDIRFLKGVDLGFVRTDTLNQLREDKRITKPTVTSPTSPGCSMTSSTSSRRERSRTSASSPARKSASTSRAAAPTIPDARCSRASDSISRR